MVFIKQRKKQMETLPKYTIKGNENETITLSVIVTPDGDYTIEVDNGDEYPGTKRKTLDDIVADIFQIWRFSGWELTPID
jgi:hypothetical protein